MGNLTIEVTWDGGSGNVTIPAGGNQTFVLTQGTEVTAEALEGDGCYSYVWWIDNQDPSYENPQVFYMDANYEAWAYCGQV
jgi:hypothetical protein